MSLLWVNEPYINVSSVSLIQGMKVAVNSFTVLAAVYITRCIVMVDAWVT